MKPFQRQDSVTDQLATVVALATAAGCYDAADWITSRINHPAGSKAAATATEPATVVQSRCSVQGRAGQCTKMRGHGQRHRYESLDNPYRAPHVPPQRDWTRVASTPLKSGSRTYVLSVGGPCKVVNERGLRTVVSIESHPDGRVNVEVKDGNVGRTRIYPASKIIYKRPKKVVSP